MATLDGKEVPECVHCTQAKPDARERTVTKPAGAVKRVLCDDCAVKVAAVYEVKPIGRASARATNTDEEGPAAADTSPKRKSKED